MNIDVLESNVFRPVEIDFTEKLALINKNFESKILPENGFYGVREIIREDGSVKQIGKNELGHTYIDYLSEGHLYKRRVNLGNHEVAVIEFDDNGIEYLTTIKKAYDNKAKIVSTNLSPNTTIVKKNFTAITDGFGRPTVNKITDLSIRPEGVARKSLQSIKKEDGVYRSGDHRGHLIPDSFEGPASQENVIAQLGKVNQGKMAQVENIVRDLKSQGHRVDYEVKTNYVGTERRPSSFEPKITIDGQEYTKLPDDLKKIYNKASVSNISKAVTNTGEKFGLAHEVAAKSGLVAGGIAFTVSTVDNLSSFIDGDITAEEMVAAIVTETGAAGVLGYGTDFISINVAQAISKSSNALLQRVGASCLPAATAAFAVESYECISDFATGKIDGTELAYELGDNAANVAGSLKGMAIGGSIGSKIGAVVGTVAGPAGTAIGSAVGGVTGSIVGGVVGCVVATEAYKTAVEVGAEGAELLAEKAGQFATETIDVVTEHIPEQLDNVKNAFKDFVSSVELPFGL